MLLDLKKIRAAHEQLGQTYEPSSFDPPDEEYVLIQPVHLDLDVHKKDDQFHLVGRVKAVLQLTCSRCADPFTVAVEPTFDLLYLPHSANAGEGEVEVEEDDLTTAYYRDDAIDLAQMMREQFYLTLPMKPLCSDRCRGLCPECGANLNQTTCDCSSKWTDPRLGALRDLLNPKD